MAEFDIHSFKDGAPLITNGGTASKCIFIEEQNVNLLLIPDIRIKKKPKVISLVFEYEEDEPVVYKIHAGDNLEIDTGLSVSQITEVLATPYSLKQICEIALSEKYNREIRDKGVEV